MSDQRYHSGLTWFVRHTFTPEGAENRSTLAEETSNHLEEAGLNARSHVAPSGCVFVSTF